VHKLREKLANIFEGRNFIETVWGLCQALASGLDPAANGGVFVSLCRSPVPRFLAALPFPIDGQTCAETTHRLFRIWVCP
jgi:hypothetical protein